MSGKETREIVNGAQISSGQEDCPVIALDRFIQATRDSGYRGTANAVSELLDNSIEAKSTQIRVILDSQLGSSECPIRVRVLDNGVGMDPEVLRAALQFGGSTRFNERGGLGRYGMGLPNSSLSQAKRVTVYSWQKSGCVYSTYLDVREIAAGKMREIPVPQRAELPIEPLSKTSGTMVEWSECDRLDNRRVSSLEGKLHFLGRRFRHFIWKGLKIFINGKRIKAIDPLYLNQNSRQYGARLYGEPLEFEVQGLRGAEPARSGKVVVTFSELPVREWYALPNKEKRALGISKGAGVSIVRAGREVDYGWYFLGKKRRENYDDWWRCEIRFDPVLDEAFGISHTKQQIRPQEYLIEALTPDIEATGRTLSARARRTHCEVKSAERFSEAELLAGKLDRLLPPLPHSPTAASRRLMAELKKSHPFLRSPRSASSTSTQYSILEASPKNTSFYSYALEDGRLALVLNPAHPFYRSIYLPLVESDSPPDKKLRVKLELMLIAAARAEAQLSGGSRYKLLSELRVLWSNTLATFLNG